jgi:prevent-host-death family protein
MYISLVSSATLRCTLVDMNEDETISVADLRRDIADVLNKAVQGEATVVTNRGRPVAALIPMADYKALKRLGPVVQPSPPKAE